MVPTRNSMWDSWWVTSFTDSTTNNNTALHFRYARYRQLAESGTSNTVDFQITDSSDHIYTVRPCDTVFAL